MQEEKNYTYSKTDNRLITLTSTDKVNLNKDTRNYQYADRKMESIIIAKEKNGVVSTMVEDMDYDEYGNVVYSGNSEGTVTENEYILSTSVPGFKILTLKRNRNSVNKNGIGTFQFTEKEYDYDGYGNMLSGKESELKYNSTLQEVESVTSHNVIEVKYNPIWIKHFPKGTTQFDINFDWFVTPSPECNVEMIYWAEGEPKPSLPLSTNIRKYYNGGTSAISGSGKFGTITGLDPMKKYIVEIRISSESYLDKFTIKSCTVTKPSYTATVKTVTYYDYASPATFGSPRTTHQEYDSDNFTHNILFGVDSCIVTQFEYDSAVEVPETGETYTKFLPTKIIQHYTDVDGVKKQLVSTLKYNRFGNITSIRKGDNYTPDILTNTYFYDGLNRLITETYAMKNGTKQLQKKYTYAKTSDARGYYTTTITHQDQYGNGANSHITKYYYNSLGQHVETAKGPDGSQIVTQKIQYDSFGRKAVVEDGIGVKTAFEYDGFSRTTKITTIDKTGVEVAFKTMDYDDGNRTVTEKVWEHGFTPKEVARTISTYDISGNLDKIQKYPFINNIPADQTTVYTTTYKYDLSNKMISTTDPRQLTVTYDYDYFGLNQMTYPGTIRKPDVYEYNYLDNIKQTKQIVDGYAIVTDYDELNRVKKVTYPISLDGRVVKYYYDLVGRLSLTTVQKGYEYSSIGYEYDLTGKVSKENHTYDGKIYEIQFTYDVKGNLTSIQYPKGVGGITYSYDSYGRVSKIPGLVEDQYGGTGVRYLNNGFIQSVSYITGNATSTTTYSTMAVTDPIDDPTDPSDPIGDGPIVSPDLPKALYSVSTTTYTPDNQGRISSIKNSYMQYDYSYDKIGNVKGITGFNALTGITSTNTYSYNALNWLTYAKQGPTEYLYNYDSAGNRISQVVNGKTTTYTYAPTELNLLTAIGTSPIINDGRGNMVSRDKGFEYVYDYSNQLTEVKKKGRTVGNYYYNSAGKRYKKTENGQNNYYIYSGENILYEESADGTVKIYYVYLNGKQIAKVENRNGVVKTYYYFTDHLGSTRFVIDGSGKPVGSVDYEPFGDEKPYFPSRDASIALQDGLESTSAITGSIDTVGTKELSTDRVQGNYSILAKIPDDSTKNYSITRLSNMASVDTEDARYYHVWVKPETNATWFNIAFKDVDDINMNFENLLADDGGLYFEVGDELEANKWNLIVVDTREGQSDGIDKTSNYFYWYTNDGNINGTSNWKFDHFGWSLKDPVTFTGKRQDDSTGLYYFNARYSMTLSWVGLSPRILCGMGLIGMCIVTITL